jgi:hypothetical protein
MTVRQFVRGSILVLGCVSWACSPTTLAASSPRAVPAAAQQPQTDADRVSVPLSDPSRPGLIDVQLVQGSITVRGTNRKDVVVIARPEADRPSRRVDPDATGMRRIPQTAGYRISEDGNRIKISAESPNRSVTFEIEAPAHTNLKLSTVNGGEILVENIEGDLDVSNVNGGITLNNVAGTVNAGTTNGNVRTTMTRVAPAKEMAFTSLNGTVDVTLPPATKANLRLRSDNGDVYSDFDVEPSNTGNGRYRIRRNRAVVGAINGGGPEFELRTFNSNVYVRKGK